MERWNLSLERSQNFHFLGLLCAHTSTVGHLLPAAEQQVQQDADRQVRVPPDLSHLFHAFSNLDQLHAHLHPIQQGLNLTPLERVDHLHMGLWITSW